METVCTNDIVMGILDIDEVMKKMDEEVLNYPAIN